VDGAIVAKMMKHSSDIENTALWIQSRFSSLADILHAFAEKINFLTDNLNSLMKAGTASPPLHVHVLGTFTSTAFWW